MKRVLNFFIIMIILGSNLISPGTIIVKAAENSDVSAQLWKDISVSESEISNGNYFKIKATFDDRNQKINGGDTIQLNWPKNGNAKIAGFTKSIPINFEGVSIGEALITLDGAVIKFSKEVEQFDQGTVRGGIEFQVQGNNLSDVTSTETTYIIGGNISIPVNISKQFSTGEGKREFSSKSGVIYPSDPTQVFWDINLNSNGEAMIEGIRVTDTISDNQISQQLLPETFYVEIKGPTINKTYNGVVGIENLFSEFGIAIDYSVDSGKIDINIPQQYANYHSFRIGYYTKIIDDEVASFKNSIEVDYQIYGQLAQHDSKEMIVDNINAGAWGEGSKTSRLTIVKRDKISEVPLSGAVFELYNEKGELVKANLVSDELGNITVSKLVPGKYNLKEVEAPVDYEILSDSIEININKPNVEVTVFNEPIVPLKPLEPSKPAQGNVEILKVDSADKSKVLSGAEFQLTSQVTGEV
ncbi:MAG: hypothetical protein LBE23_00880, partial [Vagococcus sp.]|nr:hypothetical protein [Vagococcus sp.]